jgi:murein DD-endopeptidase MepM/ murein hydrolase activator NlpD
MIKIFLIIILLVFSLANSSNIDNKISKNKKNLINKKKQKLTTKIKVKLLARQINQATKKFNKLNSNINELNSTITKNRSKLNNTKDALKLLELKSDQILSIKKTTQKNIVDNIINNHLASIAIDLASMHTQDEIIDSYVYTTLSKDSKEQLSKLDNQYKSLINDQNKNKIKIKKLKSFIKKDQKDKKNLKKLEKEYKKTLDKLSKKHKKYQKELKNIIKKQKQLSSLLSSLNIMKKQEIKRSKLQKRKEKERLKKERLAKQKKKKQSSKIYKQTKRFNENIAMDVRSIGSSSSGIKTTKYYGVKTIAPLKRYTINKKFGYFYDKVYKIKFFNDSIELKPKSRNSKVYSVFSGKVVFAKKNSGLLENVVIIKHKNNLHTIYSHLDRIAPTIRKGKWVKKGSVLGRVDEILNFQATKNSKYINPKDLF